MVGSKSKKQKKQQQTKQVHKSRIHCVLWPNMLSSKIITEGQWSSDFRRLMVTLKTEGTVMANTYFEKKKALKEAESICDVIEAYGKVCHSGSLHPNNENNHV